MNRIEAVRTRVKVVVQRENSDTPCWPSINFDIDKELSRIMAPVKSKNPFIDFDIVMYTDLSQAEADYDADLTKYDGVLVLLMTCWKKIDLFYARKAKADGLPVIVADVPYFGSGSMLCELSPAVRCEGLPVPLIASLNYADIAEAVSLFGVLHKMKHSKILVISDTVQAKEQVKASEVWGCTFVNRTAADLHTYFQTADMKAAAAIAEKWKREAVSVIEPSDADIEESARLYLALRALKDELEADAVTVDCLTLSYNKNYGNHAHMYPCLSHYEMNTNGEVAVCEADINSTIASLVILYLTGRPGYVSDPVIDTSSNQIIYAHCVACTKIFGKDDPRSCPFYLRSHAEDKLGASVQVIFPANEALTTIGMNFPTEDVCIHSGRSVGNVGSDAGCRSKLAASVNTKALLQNWMPVWHRVTVFGDYREQFLRLFQMKGLTVHQEDLL